MKITEMRFYGGARQRIARLGLADLFLELQEIMLRTNVRVLEEKQANGAGTLREMIDAQFDASGGWIKTTSGDVDWVKKFRYNDTSIVRLGVEIQVSSRSDLVVRDLVHLRNALREGHIDVGAIVLPSDVLGYFLTDRTPSFKDAIRYIEGEFKEAQDDPIVVLAIEHDGAGDALPKKKTNQSK